MELPWQGQVELDAEENHVLKIYINCAWLRKFRVNLQTLRFNFFPLFLLFHFILIVCLFFFFLAFGFSFKKTKILVNFSSDLEDFFFFFKGIVCRIISSLRQTNVIFRIKHAYTRKFH